MARFPRQFAVFRTMFIELPANAGFHGLREARKSFRKTLSFLIPGGKPAFGFGVSDFTRSRAWLSAATGTRLPGNSGKSRLSAIDLGGNFRQSNP
jgi:hypothetical protein